MPHISKGKMKQEKLNSLENIGRVASLELYKNHHILTNRTEIIDLQYLDHFHQLKILFSQVT